MNGNFLRLAAIVALVLPAAGATAQSKGPESPRDWMFHLQFGGYYPEVDQGEGITGQPFEQIFGTGNRLFSEIGLERYVFQNFGTLGIGVSVGFVQFYGKGIFASGPDAGERSGDVTSLTIVPVQAYAAYRADFMALDWGIPLVPYAKFGVGSWLWWSDGESGQRAGFSYGAGLQLQLDYFDSRLARDFDRNIGVNNSYLYVDWTGTRADGLFGIGEANGLDFSDDGMVSVGLALDF